MLSFSFSFPLGTGTEVKVSLYNALEYVNALEATEINWAADLQTFYITVYKLNLCLNITECKLQNAIKKKKPTKP